MTARRTAAAAVVAIALLSAVATAPPSCAQEVSYTGSLQASTGDYLFTERTRSLYLFNGLAVSRGRVYASASIPVILQSTPWVSYSVVGGVPTGGAQHGSVRDSLHGGHGRGRSGTASSIALPDTAVSSDIGLGDPTVTAGVTLVREGSWTPALQATGHVKPPLADVDAGFGTGAWDYGGGVSLSKRVAGRFVFVDVAYWHLGDLPDLPLDDAVAYSVAVGQPLSGTAFAVLASLSGTTRILEETDPPLQMSLGLTYLPPGGRSLNVYVAVGLSESSPDLSAGVGWRLPL